MHQAQADLQHFDWLYFSVLNCKGEEKLRVYVVIIHFANGGKNLSLLFFWMALMSSQNN